VSAGLARPLQGGSMPKATDPSPCPARCLDPALDFWAGCAGNESGAPGLFFVLSHGRPGREAAQLAELPAEGAAGLLAALAERELMRLEVGSGYELEHRPDGSALLRSTAAELLGMNTEGSDVELPAHLLAEVSRLLRLALDEVALTPERDL
jgi:hypothetical protein